MPYHVESTDSPKKIRSKTNQKSISFDLIDESTDLQLRDPCLCTTTTTTTTTTAAAAIAIVEKKSIELEEKWPGVPVHCR